MKKVILLFLVLTLGGKWAMAQEENDLKNFRFGLKATGAITWYKPDDKKKYESGGASARGGYGLIMEFRLNKVASIATGFQVDYDMGKINYLSTANDNYYWLDKDSQFIEPNDSASVTSNAKYRLNSRTYRTTYVTLPFALKLKTPEIGALTYFGMFGINSSLRLKSRVNDDVNANNAAGAHSTQTDLLITDDMNLFRFALNIGAGAEWNIAGSTSMVFGLNWYNGFSNVFRGDSKYLFRYNNGLPEATKQKATSNAIALSVGVLF
jgi:hypothetical protein